MANEFEQIVETDTKESVNEFSEDASKSLISSGDSGEVYDWSKAPDGVKAPPREDLNGKTVTITKAEVILPPQSREWLPTKSGNLNYKYCTFKLHYDVKSQQEFYSGVRVFSRDDNQYSHPTIMRDGVNQASKLLKKYAEFRKKDINEVSLREFLGFLNGQPKAEIKVEKVKNPTTGAEIFKNMVDKFVG
ncbi:hypothetical protein CMI37_10235 [Candidatus Pacearchaeota archaeon]|nr:hypothetical protein [Candidatus Pacearchaeota archaeon]|tara:strand:- start:2414 stop:2983 length:570 start_codon:yes stop_codon:yes gene_type:complete